MKSNEFRKDLVKGYDLTQEGNTLYIKGASFLPKEIDYTDIDNVKILATEAVNTADGFYDLIKKNCNTSDPDISPKAHLEMYLALSGLACEIYMKSIIYNENLHNGKKFIGHKLDFLFEAIPDVHKDAIRNKIKDIDIVLPTVGNAFETIRYDFELNHIQGDYFVLFDLMEELKKICDSYPKIETGSIRFANGILDLE